MAGLKRTDNKGRILKDGESQRPDGLYRYTYTDAGGVRHDVYSSRLAPTDRIPRGCKEDLSLREKERKILRDLEDGIKATVENKATLNDLFKSNSMEIIHTIIHPVFTLAVRDGYIRINPTDGAMAEIKKSNNWEKTKRHALTIQEQQAFVNYLATTPTYNRWLPLFTVFLGTGCRVGELIGLRWEDCDFEKMTISINHNMIYRKLEDRDKMDFYITTPKTRAGIRIIPMLSEVKVALQSEYNWQVETGFNETVIDGYSGFIFTNRFGGVYSPHTINRAIERIYKAYNEVETELAQQE